MPSSNCKHQLKLYLWEWHIHLKQNWHNKLHFSDWQYQCNSAFSVFINVWVEVLSYSKILICWIESVDFSLRCWFVFNKPTFVPNNLTQYRWVLFNSKKSLRCQILTSECCLHCCTKRRLGLPCFARIMRNQTLLCALGKFLRKT